MSSFGARRKARVIKVSDDDDGAAEAAPDTADGGAQVEAPRIKQSSNSGKKSFRQSGLRKTFTSEAQEGDISSAGNEEDDDGPVVVRPKFGSQKTKKKTPKSKLSFGGDGTEGDNEELGGSTATAKASSLGQRALENSAFKRGMAMRGLPTRSPEQEDDRPRYSKEYLDELQSSTPTTPLDTSSIPTDPADEMELDESELDGALIVDSPGAGAPTTTPKTQILTDAEIRERKERRARLAQERDFLSVEDDDNNLDNLGRKKKDETRLVAEDEELGEGFDDYVEDGGVSLGKRAEKERRKRDRAKMAELISAAEGHSSDSSSDSDAERRIAYEASQTRAGMDGLKKAPREDPAKELLQIPAKITPLPSMAECLARLQATLAGMESELKSKSDEVERLNKEKADVAAREVEVQALLDETGKKYQQAMGRGEDSNALSGAEAAAAAAGLPAEFAGERGLESLGTTPSRPVDVEQDGSA
ncbi:hypothetical protein K4F52_007819 [Lecanicillium sp. MT-2017a]|nr:hypothetical protein K4F52_007819 [Lecanicillium sp. MT-2017a]